jgi:hypothetical protein
MSENIFNHVDGSNIIFFEVEIVISKENIALWLTVLFWRSHILQDFEAASKSALRAKVPGYASVLRTFKMCPGKDAYAIKTFKLFV